VSAREGGVSGAKRSGPAEVAGKDFFGMALFEYAKDLKEETG
jgi:hypothetical protein